MRQFGRTRRWFQFAVPLVLAGLSALALCLPATVGAASSSRNATGGTTLAASVTGGLPAGGVLGDITHDGVDDILAIDGSGNLWLYPNTTPPGSSGGPNMFAGGRTKVGTGWSGYTLAAVGPLYSNGGTGGAGILARDSAGKLWYYPNTGGSGLSTFGARSLIGIGWNGYTVAGIADLNAAPGLGIVATDQAGNMWYYPGTGMTGTATFGARILVGGGWTGYTADVVDLYGNGHADVLAVDRNGNMWYYPNNYPTGSGTSTFGARSQVGAGWDGFQAVDVGELNGGGQQGVFGIDASGTLLYYPNTQGFGFATFGAPIQVGSGWTGYRIN